MWPSVGCPGAWPIGAIVPDQIAIRLPDDLAPGRYTILTGLYDPVTGERVPVLSTSDGGNVIALGRVDLP